jgi:hypothetical protein
MERERGYNLSLSVVSWVSLPQPNLLTTGRFFVVDVSEKGKGTEITSPLIKSSIDPSMLRLPQN